MVHLRLHIFHIALCIWSNATFMFAIPSIPPSEKFGVMFIRKRQAAGQAIGALAESIISNVSPFKDGPGPCTVCIQGGPDCEWIGGDDGLGNQWAACWLPGSDTFFDFDAAVSGCLTNLHFTQSDVCISVAGSACASGYGGGIMNAKVLVGNTQLSDQDSKTIQTAVNEMVGRSGFDLNAGLTFAVSPNLKGSTQEMTVFGHGASEC